MGKKQIKLYCDYIGFRYKRLNYKRKECGNICHKSINRLTKKFPRIYQFCNGNLNKFVLLLRKGVYPYEHMGSWERYHETSLPDKKAFYSELNLEDITDKDYEYAQKVREVFENFRDKCIEIYELGPAHFLSAPGLAWQACLKKKKVNLELLTNIDMLFMVEKGIKGGICQATQVC